MLRSVARHLRWTPETLGSLYLDDQDYEGLEFWYNDAMNYEKEVKKEIKKVPENNN